MERAWRGPLAWMVHMDPSWPLFMAESMSESAVKVKIEEAKRRAIQRKRLGEGEGLKSRQLIEEGNYRPTEFQQAQMIGMRKPGDKKLEKLNVPVATQPNLRRD